MASVTRDQFEIRSEFEIVHIPTGAVFQAYPYSDPAGMLQSVRVNWGQAGSPARDYAEQIRRMASQLLLVRAHQAAEGNRVKRSIREVRHQDGSAAPLNERQNFPGSALRK